MTFKDLIKTTEAIVVIAAFLLAFFVGKIFALIGAAAYLVINIDSWGAYLLSKLKQALEGIKSLFKKK